VARVPGDQPGWVLCAPRKVQTSWNWVPAGTVAIFARYLASDAVLVVKTASSITSVV
jgi:hypothetical protein